MSYQVNARRQNSAGGHCVTEPCFTGGSVCVAKELMALAFEASQKESRCGEVCVLRIDLLIRPEIPGDDRVVDGEVILGHYVIAEPEPYVRSALFAA